MKRAIITLLLLLAPALVRGQGNVTVTGHLLMPSGSSPQSGRICLSLQQFKPNAPKVISSGIIVSQTNFCVDASKVDGSFSTTLWGNSAITPSGTLWRVDFLVNGQQQSSALYNINHSPFNLDNEAPVVSTPPVTNPSLFGPRAFTCTQGTPASTWSCVHNFGNSQVIAECFDPSGHLLWPDTITQTDINTTTITYVTPTSGSCQILNGSSLVLTTNLQNAVVQNPSATQTITGNPLTVASPFNATAGGTFNGTFSHAGTETFTNIISCTSSNVMYVGQNGCFVGDIGAQINAAYTLLPPLGGEINVTPKADGSCYDFSTPILFTTSGKYVKLQGVGSSGALLSGFAGCLNYTGTTGSAITLDYVPPAPGPSAVSPVSSAHGLFNITLMNRKCQTPGGCGSSAIGIDTATTNAGAYGGTFDNVSVGGFGVGFNDPNNFSVQLNWRNPQFFYNTVAMRTDRITGLQIFGGQIAGNGTAFTATGSNSATEYQIFSTSFFSNTVTVMDVSASSASGGSLECYACHFENGNSNNARYITGPVDIMLYGGVMESDRTSGTSDWMINASGTRLIVEGTKFLAGETVTSIVVANSPVRGKFNGVIISVGHFTNRVTGANAVNISDCSANGSSFNAPTSCYFEAPLLLQGQASPPAGVAGFTNLYYGSGKVKVNVNNGGESSLAYSDTAQTWAGNQSSMTLVGPTIGVNGTVINKYYNATASITPAATAANSCVEQTFTPGGFASVVAGDFILGVTPVASMAGNGVFPVMGVRAVTAGIAITYCNSTAGSLTAPAATITITGTR